MELLLVLIVGLCTLIGSIIVFITKNNEKFINYSISISFGVILSLVLLELVPESIELINSKMNILMTVVVCLVAMFLGIFILKILDSFIPDHDTGDIECHHSYLHLAIVTSIALVVHNIFEGMAVYSSISSNLKLGLPIGIGIALHNIPLGMTITSFYYKSNKSKIKTILLLTGISLSTFVGGLITFIFKDFLVNDVVMGSILSVTFGMLVYIMVFELIPHLNEQKDKRDTILGIIFGIIIFLLSLFLSK